ncbi:MAG: YitT family protein [Flavobacteriaceae bacterium]|nr:YitT family protein [Flavobacteriaceae bacterium]
MKTKKSKIRTEIKDYAIITFSLFLYCLGVVAFLIPAKVVSGGVSGIGSLVYFFSDKTIPVAVPYLLINAVLVAIGIKLFGKKFGVKTIFAIGMSALFLYLGQEFVGQYLEHIGKEKFVPEDFLATIIGGMCAGAGIGIAISQGGSTGGTDIIALIVNKYWNLPMGKTILYLDVVIISSSYFLFQDITPMIYGFVTMAVTAYFIDFVIMGRKQSVQFFIFTEKHEEVATKIQEEIGRGISLIDSQGWYTKNRKKIVMVVTKKTESRQIFRIVKEVDAKAFISMNSVTGVYGQGFELIR